MAKHVAVLMGGNSAEREVSLNSAKGVIKSCEALGYTVTAIDAKDNLVAQLEAAQPDVVFNALHGRWGEDGCVQGLLELMKIPYTHSGVLASALAMDKPIAKRIFKAAGIPVAEDKICTREEMISGVDPMPRPYVVKPSNEGSSVGVKLLFENDNFFFTAENWPYGEKVMVERYIAGRELTSAVLDDVAMGVTELRVLSGFYDYENKYTDGRTEHICPAPLEPQQYEHVKELALRAHRALGCRGLSRSDFRLAEDGTVYILETNTQPGFTSLSLAPEMAQNIGISYQELVRRVIESAQLDS